MLNTKEVIDSILAQIKRLERAYIALTDGDGIPIDPLSRVESRKQLAGEAPKPQPRKKHRMSKARREAISTAMKARWAAHNKKKADRAK